MNVSAKPLPGLRRREQLSDEVAAHLDKTRREALFAELQALSAQCWMTGTERDIFQPLEGWAQFMTAGDGRLLPDSN